MRDRQPRSAVTIDLRRSASPVNRLLRRSSRLAQASLGRAPPTRSPSAPGDQADRPGGRGIPLAYRRGIGGPQLVSIHAGRETTTATQSHQNASRLRRGRSRLDQSRISVAAPDSVEPPVHRPERYTTTIKREHRRARLSSRTRRGHFYIGFNAERPEKEARRRRGKLGAATHESLRVIDLNGDGLRQGLCRRQRIEYRKNTVGRRLRTATFSTRSPSHLTKLSRDNFNFNVRHRAFFGVTAVRHRATYVWARPVLADVNGDGLPTSSVTARAVQPSRLPATDVHRTELDTPFDRAGALPRATHPVASIKADSEAVAARRHRPS